MAYHTIWPFEQTKKMPNQKNRHIALGSPVNASKTYQKTIHRRRVRFRWVRVWTLFSRRRSVRARDEIRPSSRSAVLGIATRRVESRRAVAPPKRKARRSFTLSLSLSLSVPSARSVRERGAHRVAYGVRRAACGVDRRRVDGPVHQVLTYGRTSNWRPCNRRTAVRGGTGSCIRCYALVARCSLLVASDVPMFRCWLQHHGCGALPVLSFTFHWQFGLFVYSTDWINRILKKLVIWKSMFLDKLTIQQKTN